MARLVTRARIKAIYTLLREFPPFDRWSLPPASDVRFLLCKTTDYGEFHRPALKITVNPDTHTTLQGLIETVAHEMAHLRQDLKGQLPDDPKKHHNKAFQRLAGRICRDLGIDPQRFGV